MLSLWSFLWPSIPEPFLEFSEDKKEHYGVGGPQAASAARSDSLGQLDKYCGKAARAHLARAVAASLDRIRDIRRVHACRTQVDTCAVLQLHKVVVSKRLRTNALPGQLRRAAVIVFLY